MKTHTTTPAGPLVTGDPAVALAAISADLRAIADRVHVQPAPGERLNATSWRVSDCLLSLSSAASCLAAGRTAEAAILLEGAARNIRTFLV